MTDPDQSPPMEADLVARGRVIGLETRGRRSGLPRRVTIGFAEGPRGSLLVAAAEESTHWARNLIAEPWCTVELAGTSQAYRADRLGDDERGAVISALIIKYGAPAERLGGGPAFRLVPAATRPTA